MKSLFVPLKTKYFDEFAAGVKSIEYRRYGRQWTEKTCTPGRSVILSHGYSGSRLNATIVSFSRALDCVGDIYPKGTDLAVIEVAISAANVQPVQAIPAALKLPF